MLLSMVALDAPSLPLPSDMLESLASLSGTAVKAGAVRVPGQRLDVPVGRQHGRSGSPAGPDSLVQPGRTL